MKLGICSWAFDNILRRPREIRELSRSAAVAGFVSLEVVYTARMRPLPGLEELSCLPAKVVSLATLDLNRYQLTDPSEHKRDCAFGIVHEMVRTAAEHGIPSVSFSPGILPPGVCKDAALCELARRLEPVIENAGDRGVVVALENVCGHLLDTCESMQHILELLPRATACIDVGNTVNDLPTQRWLECFRSRISKLHLSRFEEVAWGSVVPEIVKLGPVELLVEVPIPAGADERAFLASVYQTAFDRLAANP